MHHPALKLNIYFFNSNIFPLSSMNNKNSAVSKFKEALMKHYCIF